MLAVEILLGIAIADLLADRPDIIAGWRMHLVGLLHTAKRFIRVMPHVLLWAVLVSLAALLRLLEQPPKSPASPYPSLRATLRLALVTAAVFFSLMALSALVALLVPAVFF